MTEKIKIPNGNVDMKKETENMKIKFMEKIATINYHKYENILQLLNIGLLSNDLIKFKYFIIETFFCINHLKMLIQMIDNIEDDIKINMKNNLLESAIKYNKSINECSCHVKQLFSNK